MSDIRHASDILAYQHQNRMIQLYNAQKALIDDIGERINKAAAQDPTCRNILFSFQVDRETFTDLCDVIEYFLEYGYTSSESPDSLNRILSSTDTQLVQVQFSWQ